MSFWDSWGGRIIRQLGVYAAGLIPVVGAFTSSLVKVLDAETFRPKTPKPSATGAAPPKAQPGGTQSIVLPTTPGADLFPGSTPAPPSIGGDIGTGDSPLISDVFQPGRDLQSASPMQLGGSLFGLSLFGLIVIIGVIAVVATLARRR